MPMLGNMVRVGVLVALPLSTFAVRTNTHAVEESEHAEGLYTEEMRLAADDDEETCYEALDELPNELHDVYEDVRFLNSGMRGCGFLAKDKHNGSTVVLKVAKGHKGNSKDMWEWECQKMRRIHEDACDAGPEHMRMMQTYVPTCIHFMPYKSELPYFVMHAAPPTQLKHIRSVKIDGVTAQKQMFAELIAAVYAMHSIGWYHNDMHDRNVMVAGPDGDDPPHVALIDFGSAKTEAMTRGYHYDAESLLSGLEKIAKLIRVKHCSKHSLDVCLKAWGADEESVETFKAWLEIPSVKDTKKRSPSQGVQSLFETTFIQNNLPTEKRRYMTDICQDKH
eukprot:TRINITY_DN24376_c0_g1_i1.p1 TRINITY_DN24376_c0_g1~~TRINITY_DN24376_c0_g1_i1.p1  ORF type:complete len:368 (+),score=71.87 TRINITY_DN24376_c0_g1_i1:97-1104(+)